MLATACIKHRAGLDDLHLSFPSNISVILQFSAPGIKVIHLYSEQFLYMCQMRLTNKCISNLHKLLMTMSSLPVLYVSSHKLPSSIKFQLFLGKTPNWVLFPLPCCPEKKSPRAFTAVCHCVLSVLLHSYSSLVSSTLSTAIE